MYAPELRENSPRIESSNSIVLPVRSCSAANTNIVENGRARERGEREWPPAFWNGLRLPGEPRVETAMHHDPLCDVIIGKWHPDHVGSKRSDRANAFALTVLQQQAVHGELVKYEGHDLLVVPWWFLTHSLQRFSIGGIRITHPVDTQTGDIAFGVTVFSGDQIIWQEYGLCGPTTRRCRNAEKEVSALLEQFPWRVVGLTREQTGSVDTARIAQPGPSASTSYAHERWVEVTSRHFTVYSNADEGDARDVDRQLERFRAVTRFSLAKPDDAEPIVPIRVFAFSTKDDFKRYDPASFANRTADLAGNFTQKLFSVDICLALSAPQGEIEHVLRHEYHHLYYNRAAPWAPLWLREGLAEYWGSASFDGRTLDVGFPAEWQLETVRAGPLIPFDRLNAIDHQSPYYRERERAGIFYAESMLLAQFLLLGDENGPARLTHYGQLIQDGMPPSEAMAEVWGPLDELRRQFVAYSKRHAFPVRRMTIKDPIGNEDLAVRTVSPARLLALRADLLLSGGDTDSARKLADDALVADPDDAMALEIRGLVHASQGEGVEASRDFEREAALPDASFAAHYLAAMSAGRRSRFLPVDPAAVDAHLERALVLDSRFAPALMERALLLSDHDPSTAVNLANRAVALVPESTPIAIGACLVLDRTQQHAAAVSRVEVVMNAALQAHDSTRCNNVCWEGAIAGFAAAVLPACDKAVELEPESWNIRDSRGFARARAGERARAIEDLRWVVEKTNRPSIAASRTHWIDLLSAGKDPFDDATLSSLDTKPQ